MHVRIKLLAMEHCQSISAGRCSPTILMALFLLWTTTTCLPTWKTVWVHSTSFSHNEELMESVKKVAELRGDRLLWHRNTKYFPDITIAFIPELSMLRSSLIMHLFLNKIFFSHCLFCYLSGGYFQNSPCITAIRGSGFSRDSIIKLFIILQDCQV